MVVDLPCFAFLCRRLDCVHAMDFVVATDSCIAATDFSLMPLLYSSSRLVVVVLVCYRLLLFLVVVVDVFFV